MGSFQAPEGFRYYRQEVVYGDLRESRVAAANSLTREIEEFKYATPKEYRIVPASEVQFESGPGLEGTRAVRIFDIWVPEDNR